MKTKILNLLLFVFAGAVFVQAQNGLQIGEKADDFKLLNINGKYVSLSDYEKEKGVVVVFTCNHCPYAKAYEDRIIQLHNDYASKGFPVIAINPNDSSVVAGDSYSKMQERAKEKNYPFPYLLDDNHKTQYQFGATKTPHIFLLENKDNNFIVKYIGTIDDSPMDEDKVSVKYLGNAIEALLNGKKPDPEITKAIGCSIKVKS